MMEKCDTLNTKSSAIENKFLAILNYLAVFEVVALILALTFEDLDYGFWPGMITILIGVLIVILALLLYRMQEKRLS